MNREKGIDRVVDTHTRTHRQTECERQTTRGKAIERERERERESCRQREMCVCVGGVTERQRDKVLLTESEREGDS